MRGVIAMPSATAVTKGVRGDFGWMFRLLSGLLSTLAIVALVRRGFDTGSLSAPLALIMDAYNETVRLLLGWTEPYLQAALTWAGSFIGWRPTLNSLWRDLLVLFAIFWIGSLRATRNYSLFVPRIVMSAFIAVAIGTIEFKPDDLWMLPIFVIILAAMLMIISISFMIYEWWFARHHGHTPDYRQEVNVLTGFIGVFCFFAIDAGLKLVMG
jgi:hypothetical protein